MRYGLYVSSMTYGPLCRFREGLTEFILAFFFLSDSHGITCQCTRLIGDDEKE